MISDLIKLEKLLGVKFKDRKFLKEALTHRSYLNENPSWSLPNNERLEYLGDAVLELVVSEFLFEKYPSAPEGQLTAFRAALVNYQMLAKVAGEIGLGKYLLLSRGEAKDVGKGREVILADAFEAMVGAIYLDHNYKTVQKFIKKILLPRLKEVIKKGLFQDPKSQLQEKIQEKLKITPTYRVLSETGPDHHKNFVVGVFYGNKLAAEGTGSSKQEAERNAAENALAKLKK